MTRKAGSREPKIEKAVPKTKAKTRKAPAKKGGKPDTTMPPRRPRA